LSTCTAWDGTTIFTSKETRKRRSLSSTTRSLFPNLFWTSSTPNQRSSRLTSKWLTTLRRQSTSSCKQTRRSLRSWCPCLPNSNRLNSCR
jgi:hypothetical protein